MKRSKTERPIDQVYRDRAKLAQRIKGRLGSQVARDKADQWNARWSRLLGKPPAPAGSDTP